MTTLLISDCGGENLAFRLQPPVPVLKSAFVLPACSQWNQGHLEILSFYGEEAWLLPLGEEGFHFLMRGKKLFWNNRKQGAFKTSQCSARKGVSATERGFFIYLPFLVVV